MNDFSHQLRGFEGAIHLIVTQDPRIKPEEFSTAEQFYMKYGFRRWPRPVGGPIWQNGQELKQWCMTLNRNRSGEVLDFFMPADQAPPLSWDSDNGRLVHIPLAIS